ncbi:MAG: hypothetical protein DRP57_10040 [Spirochaetes bacterium]|nr:MAG: hypothetical protein DRP57_10040 [Spirochaetota bacterium]
MVSKPFFTRIEPAAQQRAAEMDSKNQLIELYTILIMRKHSSVFNACRIRYLQDMRGRFKIEETAGGLFDC